MKRLFVKTRLNPEFLGDHTPDVDPNVYDVEKVVGATCPAVGETMTRGAVDEYCGQAEWQVTIT